MARIHELFADYGSYHQTAGNKMCHRIGIPMIMFSLIGMLQHVPLWRSSGVVLDAAMLLIVLAELFYLRLQPALALIMLLPSALMWYVATFVPLPLHIALFVIGWIFQFWGHSHYEHRSPAFLRNFEHLLVGPLWIMNDVVRVVRPAESVS